jgi:hypothetical protein
MKYEKFTISLVLTMASTFPAVYAQKDITGGDKYIIAGESVTIGPDNPEAGACYYWEPKGLLNDNTLPNPVATVSENTTFTVTITGQNFNSTKTGSMKVHMLKVESISGMDPYTCKGKELDLTAKLTDNQPLPKGHTIIWNEINSTARLTVKTQPLEAGKMEVTAVLSGGTDTARVSTIVADLKVTVPYNYICDGSSVDIQIDLVPEGAPRELLNNYSFIKLSSTPTKTSFGNPIGTTTLTFTQFTTDLKSTIVNAIWYSTEADNCNDYCQYYIDATAIIDGNTVKAQQGIFKVSALYTDDDYEGSCGTAYVKCCQQFFAISDGFVQPIEISPDEWTVQFNINNIQKSVKTYPPVIQENPNSQYYQMSVDEELHHQMQLEGTVPFHCDDNMYNVDSLMNFINQKYIKASSEGQAIEMADEVYHYALDLERARSYLIWNKFHCAGEKDAKTAAKSSYKLALPCRHKECVDDPLICP